MKNSTPVRELHVSSKTKKGKKVFYILCYEYKRTSDKKQFNYPEFRKEFPSKKLAVAHAYKGAKALEKRMNVSFMTRFLEE